MPGRTEPPRAARARRPLRALLLTTLAALCAANLAACVGTEPFEAGRARSTPAVGAVVSEHPLATQVGLQVLAEGGNAADAAVATALALAVVYPQAGNLGGGGFALWVPHEGDAYAYDFREAAPEAADPSRYVDAQGRRVLARSLAGPLGVGVPGSPDGLFDLYRRHGSKLLTFPDLVRPAIRLAREGFPVDPWLARALDEHRERFNTAAREVFFPGGQALREGDLLRQPDLARTLERLAAQGPAGFYTGATADALIAELDAASVPEAGGSGEGWITARDLRAYQAVRRTPLKGWFRGVEVITMPPPSSGGLVLLQALAVLEGLPLDAERDAGRAAAAIERAADAAPAARAGRDDGVTERMVHWWIEALRGSFADRARHMGDPDHVDVPIEALLAPEWIASRRVALGELAAPDVRRWGATPPAGGGETTHLCVLDEGGNAVSLTTTLNATFGNGILVSGAGFLLNNELDDFAIVPGAPDQFGLVGGELNALAPGRRPLSSMTPTVVRAGGDTTTLVIGSPNGPRIITALFQVLLRLYVLGQDLPTAVAAPRLHQQWRPQETLFEPGWDPALLEALAERRGHPLRVVGEDRFGSVQAIRLLEPAGVPLVVSDARRGGAGGVEGGPVGEPARPPDLVPSQPVR